MGQAETLEPDQDCDGGICDTPREWVTRGRLAVLAIVVVTAVAASFIVLK